MEVWFNKLALNTKSVHISTLCTESSFRQWKELHHHPHPPHWSRDPVICVFPLLQPWHILSWWFRPYLLVLDGVTYRKPSFTGGNAPPSGGSRQHLQHEGSCITVDPSYRCLIEYLSGRRLLLLCVCMWGQKFHIANHSIKVCSHFKGKCMEISTLGVLKHIVPQF